MMETRVTRSQLLIAWFKAYLDGNRTEFDLLEKILSGKPITKPPKTEEK